jgi:nitroreductase
VDFGDLLIKRRSIRNFQDKDVPLPVIREILQDTCLAPTASDRQPCKYIIIRDRKLMKRLSAESKRNLLADIDQNPGAPAAPYRDVLQDEHFNVFYNAPCLIYVIGPADLASLDVDTGLTAAYLMFSAVTKGLGTCWIGLGARIRDPRLLGETGIPEGCRIVAPIIIGYPAQGIPAASERHAPEIVKVI